MDRHRQGQRHIEAGTDRDRESKRDRVREERVRG